MNKQTTEAVQTQNAAARNHGWARRALTLWCACFLLLVFWDFLVDLLLHGLHIVIEFLELGLEDMLEMIFHLESHEAQMYTAWTGLIFFMGLGFYVYVRAVRLFRSHFRSWSYFRFWLTHKLRENWLPLSLFMTAYLAALLLF